MKIWKIGSDIKNDLIIKDSGVEKHHAELSFDGNTIIVKDLNSDKGTFINDWRIKQKVIGATDKLMIGREWIDIDALLITEPKVFDNSTNDNNQEQTKSTFTPDQVAAAQLLDIPVGTPDEAIFIKFKAKYLELKELENNALTSSQKEAYNTQLRALLQAKFTLTGNNQEPEYDATKPHIVELTPERKTLSENRLPKKWYQNYQLLWGVVAALFAWSVFLMYERFMDSRGGLIISQEEKANFDFLKNNFTPRPLKIRNETGVTIQIVGFVGIRSDSTSKGFVVEKIFKEFPQSLKQGEAKVIDIAGKVIFTDIVFDYTDERQSEEPIRMQFAGSLSPANPDFNIKDNALELRLPNQNTTRN